MFEVVFKRLSDSFNLSEVVFTKTSFRRDSCSCVFTGLSSSSWDRAKGFEVEFFEFYTS